MQRPTRYNYIEERITTLCTRIQARGKLNLLDLHNHSENFYRDFCNKLYGWKLDNMNEVKQNIEAIDLIDITNKIVLQVSATSTKQKIEGALTKPVLSSYPNYNFKFVSIANDASELRNKTYSNPHQLIFKPKDDIHDKRTFLEKVNSLDGDMQTDVYHFIRKELGAEVDIIKLETNLAAIINILAQETFNGDEGNLQINPFEIERKITHNTLDRAKFIIDDYSLYYAKIDKIYTEFDLLGSNKSNSVLASIRKEYVKSKGVLSNDDLFFKVIDEIQAKVLYSANFKSIPIDELELCVNILVVDSFIRCKIFENPANYNYVDAR